MLKIRIIPCLDVRDGKVVKGVKFQNHEIVGDILDLAKLKHKNFKLLDELFDIYKVINDVIEMMSERAILKGVELAAIINENVP